MRFTISAGATVLFICATGTPAAAQAPAPIVIADAPSCATCRIELKKLVTLGEPTTTVSLDGAFRSIAALPRSFVVLTYGSDPTPKVFDRKGAFVGTIGRRGQGPGEFGGPLQVRKGTGDSLLVLDGAPPRVSVFSPDLKFVRSYAVPALGSPMSDILFETNDAAVVSAPSAVLNGIPALLHAFGRAGHEAATFDRPATFDVTQMNAQRRQIAIGANGSIWSVHGLEYTIDHWSADGQLLEQIVRQASWFPPATARTAPSPTTPPNPLIMRMHSDAEGRLWVFMLVADANWTNGLGPAQASANGSKSYQITNGDKYFDTIIEVIDPKTHRLVASGRFDQAAQYAISPDMTVGSRESDDGVPLIDVWTVRLIRP